MKRIRMPSDPQIQPFGNWLPANRGFYDRFRSWLKAAMYSESAINIYSVAIRKTIGYLQKPYWLIDPDADINRVKEFLMQNSLAPSTLAEYFKGLSKVDAFLRLSCHRHPKQKEINWEYFIGPLPIAIQTNIRDFIHHCQRNWPEETHLERTYDTLSHLTLSLRWIVAHYPFQSIMDLTPQIWSDYLDYRLALSINPKTVNSELASLKHLVHFIEANEQPTCSRFLLVDFLEEGDDLPKDVPIEQLRLLQKTIQEQVGKGIARMRRMGSLDLAWFLLMLHSGLRTGEVRRLKLSDIEWETHRVRVRQSKGLKDRLVCLSEPCIKALRSYLEIRGPSESLPENLFIFRHSPLSKTYCAERLETYGERCGFRVRPHQLRHSCATLLLNAGAPILTVQMILGHKEINTTLGYARLYDGTISADYYAAMNHVESQLALPEDRLKESPSLGQLIALVDALHRGTLTPAQLEITRALREGLNQCVENLNSKIII